MDTPDAEVRQAGATESKEQTDQTTPLSPFSPAWEREGPSLKSAVITIWQVLRHPVRTFSAPGLPGRKSATTFGVLLGTFELTLGLMDSAPFHDETAINYLIVALCLAATPFLVWGLLYLNAGITQVFLEMVKSGARDFNKTYCVVAYVGGTVAIFTAIPFLGELIGFAVCLPVGVYALAAAHGVPKSKVLLAIAAMWLAFALLAFVLKGSC